MFSDGCFSKRARPFCRASFLASLAVLCYARAPLRAQGRSDARNSAKLFQAQLLLGVPTETGQVIDADWVPQQGYPKFILIQDVHNHPQAQGHIAAIILHGYQHWGARKVFLEGAFSPVDMSVFHRIPEETRAVLLRRLVQEGNLTGPEVAGVLLMESEWRNPPVDPFQLVGLEAPSLYAESLAVYQQLEVQRPQALSLLSLLRRRKAAGIVPRERPAPAQLARLEDLVRLRMTPAEYDAYLDAPLYSYTYQALDVTRHLAERFYRLVQERSRVFISQAQQKIPAGAGPRILVVGGFHTALMAQELRAKGLSFIVIRPTVTRAGYDFLYERRMQESIFALQSAQQVARAARQKRDSGRIYGAKG